MPDYQPAPISIFNNACDSTKRRKRPRKTTTYNKTRGRKSHRRIPIPKFHNTRVFSPRSRRLLLPDWPTPTILSDIESNSGEELKPKKKAQNKNIKPH